MMWKKKKLVVGGDVGGSVAGGRPESFVHGRGNTAASASSVAVGAPGAGAVGARNGDLLRSNTLDEGESFRVPVRYRGRQRAFVIPGNYRIKGCIGTGRQVVVEGELQAANLDAPLITVSSGGRITGNVATANLQVAGAVDAHVAAADAVEVVAGGTLSGDVSAPQLRVWPGASLHGASLKVQSP